MFYSRFKRRSVSVGLVRRPPRLLLEYLEDRLVLTFLQDGQLLIPTYGATLSDGKTPDFSKAGIIAVDPSNGEQTPISLGHYFHVPTYLSEAPDGQVYVTDIGQYDESQKNLLPNTGAIIALSPTDDPQTSQRVVVSGLDGPNADAFINGSLYVTNGGNADRTVHSLAKINPSTGE